MKKSLIVLLTLVLTFNISVLGFAAKKYNPSPERKDKPKVIEDEKGNGGTINDKRGKVVVDVPSGDIIVTPISDIDDADEETAERLRRAKKKVSETDDTSDLVEDFDDIVKKRRPDTDPDDLVVDDIYDISVNGDYKEYLDEDGNTITISIDTNKDNVDPYLILISEDGETWAFLDTSDIVDLGDGKFKITLSSCSLIAFLTETDDIDPSGPVSPDTGDRSISLLATGITLSVLGCSLIVKSKKKEH